MTSAFTAQHLGQKDNVATLACKPCIQYTTTAPPPASRLSVTLFSLQHAPFIQEYTVAFVTFLPTSFTDDPYYNLIMITV